MVTSMKLRLATTVAAPSIAAVTSAGAAFNPTSAGEIVGDGYRIDGGFGQTSSFTAAFRGRWGIRIFQTRRFPNELFLQVPHLEFSLLPARDTSPGARN